MAEIYERRAVYSVYEVGKKWRILGRIVAHTHWEAVDKYCTKYGIEDRKRYSATRV